MFLLLLSYLFLASWAADLLLKKKKILHSVSGFCYLHSREQISDNPKYAFVQFHSILHVTCHWSLTFLTNTWFLVKHDPAIEQLAFSSSFLLGKSLEWGSAYLKWALTWCWTCKNLWERHQCPRKPVQRKKGWLCVSFLFCVALMPPLACVFWTSGRWWGIASALALSHGCSEFVVENRKGGTDLKAELVLPGKWWRGFFKQGMWEKFLRAGVVAWSVATKMLWTLILLLLLFLLHFSWEGWNWNLNASDLALEKFS